MGSGKTLCFYFFFHQPCFFFPELQSSSCGNPGVPAKGILNGTRFNVGDRIQYRCVSGYTLDGHTQLTCVTSTSNVAAWDFPVPICRGEALFNIGFDLTLDEYVLNVWPTHAAGVPYKVAGQIRVKTMFMCW